MSTWIAVTLALTAITAALAEQQSKSRTACKTACACMRRILQLKLPLEAALDKAAQALKDDGEITQQLLIAALSSDSSSRAVFFPLAAIASAKAQEYRDKVATNAKTVRNHLVLLHKIHAEYDGINYRAKPLEIAKLVNSNTDNFGSATITATTAEQKARTECPADSEKTDYEFAELTFDHDQKIDFPTYYTAVEIQCQRTDNSGACAGNAKDTLTVTTTDQLEQPAAADSALGTGAKKRGGKVAKRTGNETTAAIQKAHKAAFDAAAELSKHTDLKQYTTYQNSNVFLRLIGKHKLGKDLPAELSSPEQKEVEAAMEQSYGPKDGSKFTQKVWDKVSKVTASYFETKSVKQTTIGELAGEEQFSAALGLALAKQESSSGDCATTTSQTGDKQKSQCTDINDKTECGNKNGCKYNETTSKCEKDPKSTVVQTTQAGQATAGTSTGCASHKSKPDCESDKTGEKQNCAWRKGKEGEDYKDTEKCRNSGFLVNNNFALIFTSFMSLVLF